MVDEADRLLRQAYQDWLPFAVAAAGTQEGLQQQQGFPGRRVLKFVASATLTRDPAKIERLGLHCPRYLALEAADTRCICFASQALRPQLPALLRRRDGFDFLCTSLVSLMASRVSSCRVAGIVSGLSGATLCFAHQVVAEFASEQAHSKYSADEVDTLGVCAGMHCRGA